MNSVSITGRQRPQTAKVTAKTKLTENDQLRPKSARIARRVSFAPKNNAPKQPSESDPFLIRQSANWYHPQTPSTATLMPEKTTEVIAGYEALPDNPSVLLKIQKSMYFKLTSRPLSSKIRDTLYSLETKNPRPKSATLKDVKPMPLTVPTLTKSQNARSNLDRYQIEQVRVVDLDHSSQD